MIKKSLIAITTATLLTTVLSANEKLNDVVITAKSNKTLENTAGSVSIITQEDINAMNATSIQEILEEIVGINVGVNDSSISGRQTISIRGTDSKHSLILLDGKKISGTDAQIGHSDFQYSWLPISAIEKIEVVRGPMSALYGSKAIGGVINIITKRPDKSFSGELGIKKAWSASNGGDERDISFSLTGKVTDSLSLSGFIEKKDVDLTYKKDDRTATADREGKEILNGMASAWYDIDDSQQISASYIGGNEIREQQEYSSSSGITIYDKYYDIDKSHYSVGYKKDFENISMLLQYYNTSSDSHTEKYEYTHELEDKILNAEFQIESFDNNYIVFGAEKSSENYRKHYDDDTKDISSGFTGNIDNSSFYLQDEIELGEDVLLVLGARYDDHEKFGGHFSPKVNVVFNLNEDHKFKAGYGEGFNAPTVTQNSASYVFSGRHEFRGNDELDPETSKSFEIGYEGKIDNSTIKATIFKTDIEDLVDGLFLSSAPFYPGSSLIKNTYQYGNIDKVNMQGLEFEFNQKDLFSSIDLKLAYNYLKTENEATGKELLSKPKHKLNLKLSTMLPADIKSTFRIKYTGSQYKGDYEKQNSYTMLGLQFSKEMMKGLTARVGAENLTNEQLDVTDNYQLKGRVIYLGLNYKF